jgi:rod shape-determining protein MreC
VGVVDYVIADPDRDSFIDVIVKTAAHIDRLDEVLVITSTGLSFSAEQQQDMNTSEALKGAEAEAIKAQQKASEIMAERLPGLTEPNAPVANAASGQAAGSGATGQDQAAQPETPAPPKLVHPLHADRFTPGAQSEPSQATGGSAPASQQTKPVPKPKAKSEAKPGQPVKSPPAKAARSPQP